jgi:hypothetical protein
MVKLGILLTVTEKTEIMIALILKYTLGFSENKNVGIGLII